jgi:hypothetical protein
MLLIYLLYHLNTWTANQPTKQIQTLVTDHECRLDNVGRTIEERLEERDVTQVSTIALSSQM